jgi:hypothetical protein
VTRLALILAALAVWLLAAAPADAARTEYFGISQSREFDARDLGGTVVNGVRQKDGMDDARIRTSRFLLQWRTVQGVQGTWNWRQPDRIIGGLAAHGIRGLPFAWGCPRWVCPGPSRPPTETPFARTAWQNFLKAAVARYGPGGTYWRTNGLYKQQYGANATPWPITAWQVWNEPNLQKYFNPGQTTGHGIQKYAQLVKISHAAIRSRDPQARIVLAGMLGYGKPLAWDFLKGLYRVAGFKSYFDFAALHPYAEHLYQLRSQIVKLRTVMANYGDSATPLWLSEFGWGSAPPDRFGINKGALQDDFLRDSFEMLLKHRTAWNVQRLYWFLWRDPPTSGGTGCSFCGSAGLLRFNRTKKPSYSAFRSFSAEWVPPQAVITGGPTQGGVTSDPTPTFSFRVGNPTRDAGSTFICRVDARPFTPCRSPYTAPALSNGSHTFYVRAIDAPGNESPLVRRTFTVQAP